MGAARGRSKAFRPDSVINVSAMSYGALSSNTIARFARPSREGRRLPSTTPARAASRRTTSTAATSSGSWAAVTTGPRRRRSVRPRPAGGDGRREPGAGDRDQAQPRRQARPRRRAAGDKDHTGGQPHPRRAPGQGLHQPGCAPRVPRRRFTARLRGTRSPTPPGCRRRQTRRSASRRCGPNWPKRWCRDSVVSTSSPSTGEREAPAPGRSCSPIKWHCRSRSASAASTGG